MCYNFTVPRWAMLEARQQQCYMPLASLQFQMPNGNCMITETTYVAVAKHNWLWILTSKYVVIVCLRSHPTPPPLGVCTVGNWNSVCRNAVQGTQRHAYDYQTSCKCNILISINRNHHAWKHVVLREPSGCAFMYLTLRKMRLPE